MVVYRPSENASTGVSAALSAWAQPLARWLAGSCCWMGGGGLRGWEGGYGRVHQFLTRVGGKESREEVGKGNTTHEPIFASPLSSCVTLREG